MDTITDSVATFEAGNDMEAGDLVYLNLVRRNWFQKIIFWFMFWKKDTVYTITSIDSESSFTFERWDG